ncbi:MAG TPA: hypothetical protein VFA19_08530 [Gaiellaceae bacterium]|nr:hypothetical protein [Gaiellaceae bacterium]
MSAYRSLVVLLAALTAALGIVMLAVTLANGGGVGILIGVLFLAAGGGRLYLLRRRR